MNKIAAPYLDDILKSLDRIEEYISAIEGGKEKFIEDPLVQDAVVRRLEVIGEATKRLELQFREKYNHLPWRQMTGLRDVLIHDYDEVDLDMIWEILNKDLPLLRKELLKILDQE